MAELPITKSQKRKTLSTFSASRSISSSKSAVVKKIDIDTDNILDSEISVNIDIGKCNI